MTHALIDIDRPGIGTAVVAAGRRAIGDRRLVAVLIPGSHRQRVPGERDSASEAVVRVVVGGLDVGLLCPRGSLALVNIDRPGVGFSVVVAGRRAVGDRRLVAILIISTHRQRVSGERDVVAEAVVSVVVDGLDVGLLGPFQSCVGGSCVSGSCVTVGIITFFLFSTLTC